MIIHKIIVTVLYLHITILFTIKVPDSSHVVKHACMRRHMDIGRATRMSKQRSELRIRGDCVSNRL
ncbi:MAG: hypothetical protein SOY73_04015, partial [Blautia sp.]|nr:hypothetical protein [Blautia sp.]